MSNLTPSSRSFICIVCAFLALCSWCLASPIGSSPDDNFHLPSIWCGRGEVPGQCLLPVVEKNETVMVPRPIQGTLTCFAFKPLESAACQSAGGDWRDQTLVPSEHNNIRAQDGHHQPYPPGFYYVMSFLVKENAKRAALLMRGFNVFVAIFLVGALITLARGSGVESAVVCTWLVLSIPLGMFTIASNNPSSWAIIGVGTYWGFLTLLASEKRSTRILILWILAFLSALIAISSRADSAVYIALSTVAVLCARSRDLRYLLNLIRRTQVLSLVMVILSVASVLFFRGLGVEVIRSGLRNTPPSRSLGSMVLVNIQELAVLWSGAVGGWGLGWLDTRLPSSVALIVFSIACVLIVAGMQGSSRPKLFGFWLLASALAVIPFYVLIRSGYIVGEGVQPRYLLPLMYPAMGLALTKTNRVESDFPSAATLYLFTLLLSLAHSMSLHQNIRRYVTGTDVISVNLNRQIEWWWHSAPTPMTVWLVGSLSFAILAGLLVNQIIDQRHVRGRL